MSRSPHYCNCRWMVLKPSSVPVTDSSGSSTGVASCKLLRISTGLASFRPELEQNELSASFCRPGKVAESPACGLPRRDGNVVLPGLEFA